jgi:glycosyltransferase involved in cell wall biosynthesis
LRVLLTGNSCFKIANFRAGLIKALQENGHEVLVLAPFDDYHPKLVALGCTVHDLPMDRNGTAPLAEAALLWRMHAAFRRLRPDIVFGYTIKNNIYGGLSCRWQGIPFLPNVTGLGPAFNDRSILNRLVLVMYRLAFARARAVFFQNPDDREAFLKARLISDERTHVLPGSGVDLERFAAQPLPVADHVITFLLVSRLLWDKGIALFVDAAREVRERFPHARFLLLGPLDPASRSGIPIEQVEAWVAEGVIDYLGKADDVRPALAAADCVVLPSWYREGTPRILLEAAATGRPIITTDVPGCRDAVQAGYTGFLCVPRNQDSLVAAMESILAMSPTARSNMGQAARERAEANFDERLVINAYLSQLC